MCQFAYWCTLSSVGFLCSVSFLKCFSPLMINFNWPLFKFADSFFCLIKSSVETLYGDISFNHYIFSFRLSFCSLFMISICLLEKHFILLLYVIPNFVYLCFPVALWTSLKNYFELFVKDFMDLYFLRVNYWCHVF